jgi:hypothetical protein
MRLVAFEGRCKLMLVGKLEGKRPLGRHSYRRKVIVEWFF